MALTSPSSHKLTTTVRLPRVFDTYIYKTVLYYATHTQHRWPLTVHCPCLALRLAWKNHSWLGEKGLLAFYPRFGRKTPSLCWSGDVGETRLLPIYYYYCGTKPTAAVARAQQRDTARCETSFVADCFAGSSVWTSCCWPGLAWPSHTVRVSPPSARHKPPVSAACLLPRPVGSRPLSLASRSLSLTLVLLSTVELLFRTVYLPEMFSRLAHSCSLLLCP